MPTFTAVDDDNPQPDLTEKQRAALAAAFSTPAVTHSLQQFSQQITTPLAGVFAQFHQQVAAITIAQMAPVLEMAARQRRALIAEVQPQITAHAAIQMSLLKPVLDQIAQRQREWAKTLAVPLLPDVRVPLPWAASSIAADLARSLEQIKVVSPLRLELPDAAGFDRLSGLVGAGEFDARTLADAEADVAGDTETSAAIDEAAELLTQDRPWISRKRARMVLVLWVWLMWSAALTVAAVYGPSTFATFATYAGLPAGLGAANWAGERFDRRYPPENEPGGD